MPGLMRAEVGPGVVVIWQYENTVTPEYEVLAYMPERKEHAVSIETGDLDYAWEFFDRVLIEYILIREGEL